ncbi:MAG: hypothetical protein LBR85_02170 [Oscillospiraceae bacterium]|jgi:hypothetical protein|nr:hypothetical protein [Oscillospiraceae bacterium]
MEHIDLINRIIEAEQEAQRIAGEARDKLRALPADLKSQTDKVRRDLYARADSRIEEVRREEEQYASDTVAELDARFKSDLAELEGVFAAHSKAWEDRLFALVTER